MRDDRAARADAEGLQKLHCSGLSPDQSVEAWQLAYCGIFGVTPRVIALAPGSQIDISRRGLVLDTPAGRTTLPLMSVWGGMVGCGHQVPLLRYTRVDPPIGLALPARHLLELAEWSSAPGATTGTMERMLAWHLFDITSKIDEVAFEFLGGRLRLALADAATTRGTGKRHDVHDAAVRGDPLGNPRQAEASWGVQVMS
jgi:hypothetical protein